MKHFLGRLITVKKKKKSIYQNNLWLRFIRTSKFLFKLKFLILSVVIFKKDLKTSKQHLISKFERMEIIPFPLLSNFLKKHTSARNKIVSHCMIIEFIILIPVMINFLTIFPNNNKVLVLKVIILAQSIYQSFSLTQ